MRLSLILSLVAAPALADIPSTISDHILPGHERLASSTAALADSARTDCSPEAVTPAFHEAYDAWIAISHIQFGPIEDQQLSLAMAFWPDPKDRTGRALSRLVEAQDPIIDDAIAFNEVSAAAQGFTALERLLYEPQTDTAYACRLTAAIAQGLADKSRIIAEGWPAYADLMLTAGEDGNTRFQTPLEVKRAAFTALSTGLEFLHDARLGRPLGTFDRPRPRRAEARRSERSVRHITLALSALEDLATHLSTGPTPETTDAFTRAKAQAAALDDPALAGVAEPGKRIRIEALQVSVGEIQAAVINEIGVPLEVTAGFNALDGD
ncbi:MAG: imelysin family protein [Pseudomonadota bacterium]